jgi:DNA-binding GntR family transcriptional regulator
MLSATGGLSYGHCQTIVGEFLVSESYGSTTFSQSARHRVRNGVEQKILCGEFPSGTKLRQVRLAEHFGVGQGVVREALIELQLMGLVEIVDNRGVFVTHLNGKKLKDAIEVRAAIEGMAVRLCCGGVSQEQLSKLRRSADLIFQLSSAELYDEAAASDRELHLDLVRLSGNEELLRLTVGYRAFGKIMYARRDPKAVLDDHCAILDAIAESQPAKAEELVRAHIEQTKEWLAQQLEADSDFIPKWVI